MIADFISIAPLRCCRDLVVPGIALLLVFFLFALVWFIDFFIAVKGTKASRVRA